MQELDGTVPLRCPIKKKVKSVKGNWDLKSHQHTLYEHPYWEDLKSMKMGVFAPEMAANLKLIY